mgnify:FL=1
MCELKILDIECLDCEYLIENKITSLKECEVKYNNDGSFNRLQITNENLNMLDFKTINKKTIKNIKKQKGFTYKIEETNNNIIIDKKTSKEYTFSRYTRKLNIDNKIIKNILSKYLKEIINNSSDRKFVNYKKKKHIKDAKYGFYKYKITFSIINKNIENIYEATVLIRNSEDTKKYLYDVLNIKKLINPASTLDK